MLKTEDFVSAETVFLSYVAEDAALAARLKDDLARAGVSVVDRALLVKPGNRRGAAVRQAIKSASKFLLCLSSRDGLPPAYEQDELAAAIAAGRSIIPLRLTRCDVPSVALDDSDTVADLEAVDLYNDWTAGVERLTAALPALPRGNASAPASSRFIVKGKRIDTGQLRGQATDMTLTLEEGIAVSGTTEFSAPK